MSTYRGFDKYMISRATRARGDRHYFDERTLRYFNAYGGQVLSAGADHMTMVESIRNDYDGWDREYRVIDVRFTRDDDGREHVTVRRLVPNYSTAREAVRIYRSGMDMMPR